MLGIYIIFEINRIISVNWVPFRGVALSRYVTPMRVDCRAFTHGYHGRGTYMTYSLSRDLVPRGLRARDHTKRSRDSA